MLENNKIVRGALIFDLNPSTGRIHGDKKLITCHLPEPDHHRPHLRILAAAPAPADRASGRERAALLERPSADERGGQTARLLMK